MTTLIVYAVFVLLMYALMSCEKECLCHFTDVAGSRGSAEVGVDWNGYDKENVSGMTVMCYSDGWEDPRRIVTNGIGRATFILLEDFYDFLVFSHSDSEYGSLRFSGMNSFSTAAVNAVDYQGTHWLGDVTRVIAEPDWLAVGTIEDAAVSFGNTVGNEGFLCACSGCCCESLHADRNVNLGTVAPENVIYSLEVRIDISGIGNLRFVRASISGVAESLSLSSCTNGPGSASQLMQSWQIHRESAEAGYIESTVRTFGLPSVPTSLVFDLQLMLIDGKTVVRNSIDVSDFVTVNESDKIISLELALTERLPDTKPASGGGFDATVNGWEEAGDIDIILKKD